MDAMQRPVMIATPHWLTQKNHAEENDHADRLY